MIGSKLAHFEIKSHLGSGGMGDVYEAADSKLGRSVAIKFLPDAFALDADRVERFEREARVLASLNHSRIAGIYGLEESSGKKFLVMELVPGETLAERIARGAMPLDEALATARQIVEALEAAHEKGIVHRDLKPANVKITPDGSVKVLDFGLAKALDADGADANVSNSPTRMHTGGSMPGMILGTAPYMSPEQARGRVVDRRTDTFAFGCVLYEMLTGARAFDGEDAADILSAVMRVEPDWSRLPAGVPSSIRTLLRLCLEKNVKNRRSDSTDLRLDLELALKEQPAPNVAAPQTQPAGPRRYLWPAAALLLGATSVFLAQRSFFVPAPDVRVVQFDIAPPEGTRFNIGSQYELLSPDGRKIAFVANVEGKNSIWVRPLDSPLAIRLAGTEGASALFWSGDSQDIGFLANNQIKRTPATGGPVQVVTKDEHREAAWNAQGVILLGGDRNKPILQVPAAGGEAKPVMELDASRKEVSHDYPSFLPDGRHFLYMAREPNNFDLYVGDLQSKERRLLPNIKSGAVYSPTGHIIFGRGGTLMAQPFDLKRLELTGDAFPIGERYGNGAGPRPFFSASTNGAVAYVLGGNRKLTELGWFDRTGKALATAGPMAEYFNAALSPDARFVAFERGNPADIWIMDLQKGLTSRFTTADKFDGSPVWSADGKSIVFTSARSGLNQIYQRTVGVVGEDQLLRKSETPQGAWDWSRDGKYLAFNEHNDILAMPLAGDGKPIAVTQSPFAEYAARISPDGAWVAYVSNENGSSVEDEVYIQSFPNPGPRQQVSTSGGYQPQWKADGSELYYVSPDRTLMAVSIKRTGKSIEAGAPVSLFQMRVPDLSLSPLRSYNVSADGRFLLNVNKEDSFASPIRVMINWTATLKK